MHIVNDQLKRLEPQDTKCVFCGTAHSRNMEDNVFVPVFKEQDRTNVIVYRSVKYQKIPIGLPRCESCKQIHAAAGRKSKIYAWTATLIIVIASISIWGLFGIFSVFAGVIVGFGGAQLLENQFVRDQGILTKMDGAKENDTVQDFIINGWSFSQPAA